MAVHPGLTANVPLRRLDPLVRPTLQRLAAQQPHLLDKPLFGRVRQPEVSVQVPHRAHDRRHSVAETRMGLEKRQKRFVAEFHGRHGSDSLDCRIVSLLHTRKNRTLGTIPVLVLAQWEHPVWGGVTHGGWASIAYISSLPLSVAYLAWFRALKLVPASTAATTVLVSPMVGVIGSTLLLGEALGPRQLIALAMTLTGVALAARG